MGSPEIESDQRGSCDLFNREHSSDAAGGVDNPGFASLSVPSDGNGEASQGESGNAQAPERNFGGDEEIG